MPPEHPCPAGERKGARMMPDNVALFATIILLLPMIYFLLAAPAFLLVRLDIPAVALLLRAMFNGYFLTLAIAGAIGTIAVALAGRLVLAIGIGLVAAFAASSRRWFMRQMDARLSERQPRREHRQSPRTPQRRSACRRPARAAGYRHRHA